MSDMRIGSAASNSRLTIDLLSGLPSPSLAQSAPPQRSRYQVAQATESQEAPKSGTLTREQWKEAVQKWEKQKAENPFNLNNFFGMNSDEMIKQMGLIGAAAESPQNMKAALAPLDAIAVLTGVQSPAALGSNWEQKTAFMTNWVRATTNNISASTQGIQVVNQLYQAKAITANEARLRIAGHTLRAQTESAKLNTFGTLIGQVNLKLAKNENKLALENLKLQVAQNQTAIKTTLKTATLNLDTIDTTVRNQSSGVRNSAVSNLQQFENLRLQALNKVRGVAPEPRPSHREPDARLEFDAKTGVPLPRVPTREADYLTASQTRAMVLGALPIAKNGKPAGLATSPKPGVGTSPSEVAKVAAVDRTNLKTMTGDLKNFAGLSEQQFKAKFGATRTAVQSELSNIRKNIPVPIDTKTLIAATQPTPPEINEARELAEMKDAARKSSNLKPETKQFIEKLTVKTKAQYEYVTGVALFGEGGKLVGGAYAARKAGRRITEGPADVPGAKGANRAKALERLLPSADLTQLNNLYGQIARNKNLEQTIRSYQIAVGSERLAGAGLGLARNSYQQSLTALAQGAEQNKVAVDGYRNSVKALQTQLETVQSRVSTLDINDSRLVSAKQSLDVARRVGDIGIQTATINNKVAAQSGRITAITGENNTFMASLGNVVTAGQDYNVQSLKSAFVEAPTAMVMTDKGLVVRQKVLNAAYGEVKAKAGANAGNVRYDTPAVLNLARAKTHLDFQRSHPEAAKILLAAKPNSVGMASIGILRDGSYDMARKLMPANLTATPPRNVEMPSVPTRIIWGQGAVPAWAAATPLPMPTFPDSGVSPEQVNEILHGNRKPVDLDVPRRAP